MVGRLVGGPKFWPAISPNKTWSGVFGGWLLAVGVGMVYWMSGLTMINALLLAIVLSALSQIGDLAESAMKRRAGAKDGGRLIPGHGGLVDRFRWFGRGMLFRLAGVFERSAGPVGCRLISFPGIERCARFRFLDQPVRLGGRRSVSFNGTNRHMKSWHFLAVPTSNCL